MHAFVRHDEHDKKNIPENLQTVQAWKVQFDQAMHEAQINGGRMEESAGGVSTLAK